MLNDGSGATGSASISSKQKAAKSSPRSIAAAVALVEFNGGGCPVTKAAGATGGNKLSHEEKSEDAAAAAGKILTAIEEDNEMEIQAAIESLYAQLCSVYARFICGGNVFCNLL